MTSKRSLAPCIDAFRRTSSSVTTSWRAATRRSALVTDVDLIEEHPISYAMEASRRHRWTRGDWQLAGWLLPSVRGPEGGRRPNPLTPLSMWKLFDNLRRSLVPAALLLLLLGGWLWGPGPSWFWELLVVGVLFVPPLLTLAIEFVRKPEDWGWPTHLVLTGKSALRPLARALLTLVLIPYDASVYVDAILRSGAKMLFTRRGLMLWHMPSYSRRNARHTPLGFLAEMWIGRRWRSFWLLCWPFVPSIRSSDWPFVVPLLVMWLVSPIVGWWISAPLQPVALSLTSQQQTLLRALSAARGGTSPTSSVRNTTAATGQLSGIPIALGRPAHISHQHRNGPSRQPGRARFRVHLDRRTSAQDRSGPQNDGETGAFSRPFLQLVRHAHLQPLNPQYISSVDSGNLAASLLTLRAGLDELKQQPVLGDRTFEGLEDTLEAMISTMSPSMAPEAKKRIDFVKGTLRSMTGDGRTMAEAQVSLRELCAPRRSWRPILSPWPVVNDAQYWARALNRQCRRFRDDLMALAPESQHDGRIPTLEEVAAGEGVPDGSERPIRGASLARKRLGEIDDLIARCQELSAMDFDFLYDPARDLLSIGYDIGERRRDPSWYDLLASEARLTSFLLIAEGQVPQKHWFALGRLLTSHGGDVSLISWSGSMFEYLLPRLFLPSYENTLLEQACQAAVSRQIEYGRQRHVPWGISESCYNAVDMNQVYQYRAFGVPGLGFKRGLGEDLVIAPYATALALTVVPRDACRNLQTLATAGFLGDYGLYEAVDYTSPRLLPGKDHAVVRCFMAHHQGMSLLAFAHALLDDRCNAGFSLTRWSARASC